MHLSGGAAQPKPPGLRKVPMREKDQSMAIYHAGELNQDEAKL